MLNDFDLIRFTVTKKYYGVPQPYIPNGTIVLLIQDGRVGIRKYEETTDDDPVVKLVHPKDHVLNEILEADLLNIIKYSYPQYLLQEEAVTLICPKNLLDRIVW